MLDRTHLKPAMICLLALCCAVLNLFAQSSDKLTSALQKFSFDSKIVTGSPYSAVAIVETVRPLTDGNRIRFRAETLVYRDSEGRTRRETQSKNREVFIVDPVESISYTLLPDEKRVFRFSQPLKKRPVSDLSNARKLTDEELKNLKLKGSIEHSSSAEVEINGKKKTSSEVTKKSIYEDDNQAPEAKRPDRSSRSQTEQLGEKMIEGVRTTGQRTTLTIPVGEVGNELPIKVVTEHWYSPELQLQVMTRRSDPRDGETTYRLTRINRSEPDSALFRVPADYSFGKPAKAASKPRTPSKEREPKPSRPARKPRDPRGSPEEL
jgi:hypothetical protein